METRTYTYNTLSGDKSVYNNSDMLFKFDGPHYNVKNVKVNGTVIDTTNYAIVKGSTVLTLNNDYLKALEGGEYEVSVVYNNDAESTAKATFTVPEKQTVN